MSTENEQSDKPKWPEIAWDEIVDLAEKIVFQVVTESCSGTCFAVSLGAESGSKYKYICFVTAWHVIEDIDKSKDKLTLISSDRKTVIDAKPGYYDLFSLGPNIFDTALFIIKSSEIIVKQEELLPMLGYQWIMPRGAQISWVGFPGIVKTDLCFFSGHVSGYINEPPTYLIDGVAINGVSGGPAFDNRAHIIGLVSAYIPNKVDETTTLPGLMALVPISSVRYYMENMMKARII
ncbi:MAG: trypsin-like peptidase domain-containing protein [Sedimentisphaerales bacterium]|nr:trypsin-like peptidase domain-containing protein [Sedimentisphaerales bacterium]